MVCVFLGAMYFQGLFEFFFQFPSLFVIVAEVLYKCQSFHVSIGFFL
jgi:hypothetical protein